MAAAQFTATPCVWLEIAADRLKGTEGEALLGKVQEFAFKHRLFPIAQAGLAAPHLLIHPYAPDDAEKIISYMKSIGMTERHPLDS